MIITFDGTQLCDNEIESHQGFALEGRHVFEEQERLDAPELQFADRGNGSVSLDFSVVKEHASARAAEVFFLEHPQSLNGIAATLITTGESGDQQVIALGESFVECVSLAPPRGLLTEFAYRIEGSQAAVDTNTVAVSHIPSTAQAFAITPPLQPGHIASTAQVFTPGFTEDANDSVAIGHIASTAQAFGVSLIEDSNDTVAPAHIASSSAVYSLTVQEPPTAFGAHSTLSTNLVRAYKLEDLTDETGNSDLSLETGSASSGSTGVDGDCYDFTNAKYETGWLPAAGSFSVSVWVNADTIGSGSFDNVFGAHDNGNHRCYLGMGSSDQVVLAVGDAIDTGGSAGTYSTGTWYHLILTYDGTTAKLFVDGILRISISAAFSGTSATDFQVGGQGSNRFDGLIDEVYIWDRALTDGSPSVDAAATGEIGDLWNSGSGLFY